MDDARHHGHAKALPGARAGKKGHRSRPAYHTVAAAAEDWLKRQVRAKGFRTVRERERIVERHIIPSLGSRAMSDVRRDDLTAMLDRIEDESGAPMADAVLRILRSYRSVAPSDATKTISRH